MRANTKPALALAVSLLCCAWLCWNGLLLSSAIVLAIGAAWSLSLAKSQRDAQKLSQSQQEAFQQAREALLNEQHAQNQLSEETRRDAERSTWESLTVATGVEGFGPFARYGDGWICRVALKDGVAYEFDGLGQPDVQKGAESLWINGMIYIKAAQQPQLLSRVQAQVLPAARSEKLPLFQPVRG